ncbi:Glycosyl transferases group 1 [Nocardioides alpinus]|uniref:Glycosyl transferase family 1 n=1 Tax=Nocardioides alpinus TaxID=748909 RepID=A0A1I0W4T8_9ACTN|nr:glycosyltransferase family 4 protein [Nocardioides alpinus]PKH37669.1 glycosyl transferase family 1 [Nocardioides alpinus]SFA83367.1 Glycosyl transferases group 1 [Nocardioides alpinus]
MHERIHLAANNPDLGGGEQMLIRTAAALVSLDRPVTVVAPDAPTEVLDAAAGVGADVVAIRADGRRDYLQRLREWDRRERAGLLWCHGLVPSLATSGRPRRLVHLHQQPRSLAQEAALLPARLRSERTLTPSAYLSSRVRHSSVFANWTDDVARLPSPSAIGRVGFLGRLSTDKGLDLVARAMATSPAAAGMQLVVAGDDRWVPDGQRDAVIDAMSGLGDRVHRLGRVSPAEFFAEIDLAVLPSRVAESFGLVVAEAMAAGIPFVISDAGALPEVAGPDHPWVARAGDADDLARVIEQALAATPDDVRVVTDRARLRWEDDYSPQAGRSRVERLLEELGVT